VNFGILTAEICWRVWGTPAYFNGFRVLAALLHGTLVVGVSQPCGIEQRRHLYSAGRPSRWALAHISSFIYLEDEKNLQSPLERADWQKGEILLFFSIPCQVNINELFYLHDKNKHMNTFHLFYIHHRPLHFNYIYFQSMVVLQVNLGQLVSGPLSPPPVPEYNIWGLVQWSFLQARCPSCRRAISDKALKEA